MLSMQSFEGETVSVLRQIGIKLLIQNFYYVVYDIQCLDILQHCFEFRIRTELKIVYG
jgi:hypothetical protein